MSWQYLTFAVHFRGSIVSEANVRIKELFLNSVFSCIIDCAVFAREGGDGFFYSTLFLAAHTAIITPSTNRASAP